jgi:hypothetical protein
MTLNRAMMKQKQRMLQHENEVLRNKLKSLCRRLHFNRLTSAKKVKELNEKVRKLTPKVQNAKKVAQVKDSDSLDGLLYDIAKGTTDYDLAPQKGLEEGVWYELSAYQTKLPPRLVLLNKVWKHCKTLKEKLLKYARILMYFKRTFVRKDWLAKTERGFSDLSDKFLGSYGRIWEILQVADKHTAFRLWPDVSELKVVGVSSCSSGPSSGKVSVVQPKVSQQDAKGESRLPTSSTIGTGKAQPLSRKQKRKLLKKNKPKVDSQTKKASAKTKSTLDPKSRGTLSKRSKLVWVPKGTQPTLNPKVKPESTAIGGAGVKDPRKTGNSKGGKKAKTTQLGAASCTVRGDKKPLVKMVNNGLVRASNVIKAHWVRKDCLQVRSDVPAIPLKFEDVVRGRTFKSHKEAMQFYINFLSRGKVMDSSVQVPGPSKLPKAKVASKEVKIETGKAASGVYAYRGGGLAGQKKKSGVG